MLNMLKITVALFSGLLVLLMLPACSAEKTYQDGTYSAEFENFDSRGYKDFIKITIENGVVTKVVYNSKDADENLKTNDETYSRDMEKIQGTYPEKFTADLVNQYLNSGDIEQVDAVAGATYSSESFMALVDALEKSMINGDETLVIVPNITEH